MKNKPKAFRANVAAQLAKHGVTSSVVKGRCAVDIVISEIVRMAVQEGRAEIRGFGIFTKRTRPRRVVRNPRTRLLSESPPTWKIVFKPGKDCRGKEHF